MTKQEQKDAAWAAYEAIQDAAWAAYEVRLKQVKEDYRASKEQAWASYGAIQEPAYAAYTAELERIENAPEKAVVGDWEAELEDLAAINYNLYLAGTVKRADTQVDWTHEQALSEIKAFIHTLLAAKDKEAAETYKKGFIDGGLSK